jgi:transcriptional regulator with XRE-family HTH domain
MTINIMFRRMVSENMVIDYNAIGLRIKFARIKAKITQEALATKIGMSTTHVSNIETGNAKLSLPAIINIANVLAISVDDLLCDNVIRSNHVFNKEAQNILIDCSPYDIRILLDVLKSTKEALQKNEQFKQSLKNTEIP